MSRLQLTRGTRRVLSLATAVVIAGAVVATGALAATGSLSNPSCIRDTGGMGCASTAPKLSRVHALAISPDGRSLYAAAWLDNAVVYFDRDPVTGVLSNPRCFEDPSGPTLECGAGRTAEGLRGAGSVAVSPTGNSVYVLAFNDESIVRFNRNTSTGELTSPSCIEDDDVAATGCGATAPGIAHGNSLAISPNGASLYLVSGNDPLSCPAICGDNAIVRFNRDAAGALTGATCIEDPSPPDAGCGMGNTAEGLNGASSVAISPDGNSVYVASTTDDAVVRFNRNTGTGALTGPSCIEDDPTDAGCGMGNSTQGLDGAAGVTVSSDGASVYVASRTDGAIVRFNRNAVGALSGPSCIEDPPIDESCGASAEGLFGATGVALSPLGDSVHVASFAGGPGGDNAVVSFGRAPDGALTGLGCFEDPPIDENCGASAEGLAGASGLAVGPESRTLHVASETDDALVRFDREIAAAVPPAAPPAPLAPATDPAPETMIGKGPRRKGRARRPGFSFGSNEVGATFLCRLLGKRVPAALRQLVPCVSPFRLPRLGPGKKSFQVSAMDAAGNVDPTPALFAFKILP
jgi:DNA-binding beta-propeller fold protein YncE